MCSRNGNRRKSCALLGFGKFAELRSSHYDVEQRPRLAS